MDGPTVISTHRHEKVNMNPWLLKAICVDSIDFTATCLHRLTMAWECVYPYPITVFILCSFMILLC